MDGDTDMDVQQTGDIDRTLAGLARSVEAVLGLPAVPTLDWCDRAASATAAMLQPAIGMITIGTLTDSGDLVEHEVTGVGMKHGVGDFGRASRSLHRDEIGYRGEDSRVSALRVRASGLRKLGLRLSADDRRSAIIGTLDRLPGAADRGEIGELWSGLDLGAPMVAVVPLGEPEDGRVMIVQIARADASEMPVGDHAERAFAALLPVLGRRTAQALGAERSETTRWLTEREQLVLEHLSLGKSVRQIAEELGRSPHTVHDHVKGLHRKLGASSRGELVARALGHTSLVGRPAAVEAEAKPVRIGVQAPASIEPKPTTERSAAPNDDPRR
ncbi:MAG: LuxR C-terminal-related transcriptional regulator [Planctomycetota bacterium]